MRLRDLYRDRAVWLYGLLTAAFFYRPLTTQTFFFRDLYLFFYPKKVLLASALRQGTLPLWDPFTNGGQPYLATPTYAALHPSNLLYAILPVTVAFNLIPVLHIFFCAVAAYWLGRVVRLSPAAAFVTGIGYGFAGVTLSGGNLSAWLLALPWIPMTAGLTHRALRDGRSIAAAAVSAAMPLYAGMAELTGFMLVTLIVWVIATRGFSVASLLRIAIVLVAAAGLSLPVTLPATSVLAQSSRGAERRSYESFTSWSVHPRRLPELIIPQYFGPTDTLDDRDYRGRAWETDGFPYVLSIYFGAPLLLLAMFGAARRLEHIEAPRRSLAALAMLALLLALGRYLPGFRFIYDFVPLVTLFRFPVKALVMAVLPIAVLAGCGAEQVARDRRSALLIAAVVTIDLLSAGWPVNAYAPRSIFDEPSLAGIVREEIGPLRLYSPPRPMVLRAPSNEIRWLAQWQLATLNDYSASTFGIPVVYHTDFDGLAPRAIARFGRAVQRLPWPRAKPLLDAAGVRAILTMDTLPLPEIVRVPTPSGPLRLYVNPGAYAARFEGPCGGGTARILRRELNSARYEVDAPCSGRVIFSENHYDGWRAFLDGREVPHARALGAFTSIAVPAGHHAIERTYFPPRLIAGLIGLLTTSALLLVGEQLARRRQHASLVR